MYNRKPFAKIFQIRWKEALGEKGNPYLYRWMIIIFGFSIRLHHWIRSDDPRYLHDHSCNFISFILKGDYMNITEDENHKPIYKLVSTGQFWYSNALKRHRLYIPEKGAWTLLFCGRPYHKWGFYVNGHKWRPLRYFHKFGVLNP